MYLILSRLCTLHVHEDHLNCIDDSAVMKDFVACDNVRIEIFETADDKLWTY